MARGPATGSAARGPGMRLQRGHTATTWRAGAAQARRATEPADPGATSHRWPVHSGAVALAWTPANARARNSHGATRALGRLAPDQGISERGLGYGPAVMPRRRTDPRPVAFPSCTLCRNSKNGDAKRTHNILNAYHF